MPLDIDRLKAPIFALIRAALPRVNYFAPRIARVVSARTDGSGQTLLDVAPEDPAFPGMGGVPFFHGEFGMTVVLQFGTRVLVEFSEGDPARPFVRSAAGGETVVKTTIAGQQVFVGGETGAEPPIKGASYRTAEKTMNNGPAGLVATLGAMATACTGPLAPLGAGFTALAKAIGQFETTAAGSNDFQATNARAL